MRSNRGFTLIEFFILLSLAIILGIIGFNFYERVTCKNGHEVVTGDMVCFGSEGSMNCSPERQFICDDP